MSGFVLIDTSEFKKLAKRLHATNSALEKELQTALVAAAEVVAVQARHNADSFPRKGKGTNRISKSIKVRRRALNVRVQAGGPGAPEATPLEIGSQGNPGRLRHPVFGNYDVWRSQPTHPFLSEAVDETKVEVAGLVEIAMDNTLSRMVI